jgi:hypothetical protein
MLHLLDQSQCSYLSSPPSCAVERARPRPTSDLRRHRTPYRRDRCSWAPASRRPTRIPSSGRSCKRRRSLDLVVHAEKGDGGLTDAERVTRDAAPLVTVVRIPGAVFFLPDEAPRQIAEVDGRRVGASLTFLSEGPQRRDANRPLTPGVGSVDCWAGSAGAMMWTRTWPRVSGTRGVVFMAERHIRVQRRMAASIDSVWALFADFPNLGSHWRGLRATRAIGDQTGGVGARRRVELKPIGSMDETVTFWEEGRRIDTQNLPSASVPFKHAESTLTLEPDAEGTLATFDYRYVPRGGPLGRLVGPLIDKMLTGTFTDMLAATDEAARASGSER